MSEGVFRLKSLFIKNDELGKIVAITMVKFFHHIWIYERERELIVLQNILKLRSK